MQNDRSADSRDAPGSPVRGRVRLDIGEQVTRVSMQVSGAPSTTLHLALGSISTSRRFFRNVLPEPSEWEAAIDAVEAEVMLVHPMSVVGSELVATGAALHEFGQAAGAASSGQATATLEAVEQIFQRLAAESLGAPSARAGLPCTRHFAATALILREFMHHLGFSSIRFAAGDPL